MRAEGSSAPTREVGETPIAATIDAVTAPLRSTAGDANEIEARASRSTIAFVGAMTALGYAIQAGNGFLTGRSLLALTVGVVAALIGSWLQRTSTDATLTRVLHWVCAGAVAFQFVELCRWPASAGSAASPPIVAGQPLDRVLSVAAGTLVLIALRRPVPGIRGLVPVILIHFLLGRFVLRLPPPQIDVIGFHETGIAALLDGRNPYTTPMPNVYGIASHPVVGVLPDGRLDLGFPYLPMPLILAAPAQRLLGDYRYASLIAMEITALLICLMGGRTRTSFLVAVLFLFTPRGFFVLEQGWNEPLALSMLAIAIWCMRARPRWGWVPLGLLFASKQYILPLVPVSLLAQDAEDPPGRRIRAVRSTGLAILVASAVALVACHGDVGALWKSAFDLHLRMPWRRDALSFCAWLSDGQHPGLPGWFPAAIVTAVLVLAALRARRDGAGFAAAVGTAVCAGFAVAPQNFANYVYFSVGALGLAIAASSGPSLTPRAPAESSATD